MKRTIQLITISIILLTYVSAVAIYSGEPYSFDLGGVYSYYEITGNSTEVNLNISQLGNIVTIIPDKYMKESNFTITFYGESQEIITSSGGSSRRSRIKPLLIIPPLDNYSDPESYPRYYPEVINLTEDSEEMEIIEQPDKPNHIFLWIILGIFLLGVLAIVLIKLIKNRNRKIYKL